MTELRTGSDGDREPSRLAGGGVARLTADDGARQLLFDERDHLLASIVDLDAELAAGDIDPADHAKLREDYTARAAAVLRALEGGAHPVRPAAAVPVRSRSPVRTALVVVAVAVAAGGAGLGMARGSGERLPGQELSGDIVRGSGDRIAQAQALAADGRILEAIKLYDEALTADPDNPVALAQRGWLVSRAGLGAEGLETIDRALEIDPEYPDAWFFKAMIHWRITGEPDRARAAFERLLDLDPPAPLADFVRTEALPALDAGAPPPSSTP